MLQSMGLQSFRHDLATKQQQQQDFTVIILLTFMLSVYQALLG